VRKKRDSRRCCNGSFRTRASPLQAVALRTNSMGKDQS
jgi:hypothetical protein